MESKLSPFHLAIPVQNLEVCRTFYRDFMGCTEGRSDSHWVDFNFFGHQLVIHEKAGTKKQDALHNPVDGHEVPVPHFGVVLLWEQWHELKDKLIEKSVKFVIEPYIRFKGRPGEQATMFFQDPEGNALEFKSFKNMDDLFRKE
jgi:extradiol dioxygenase family protein